MKSILRITLLVTSIVSAATAMAAAPLSDGRSTLSADQLRYALMGVQPNLKARILADKDSLARFAAQLMQDQRIEDAAKQSGYANQEQARAVVERAARDALVAKYIEDGQQKGTSSAPDFKAVARERYAANTKDFVRPEAIRIAHILIPVDVEDENFAEDKQRVKAQEILAKLRAGEDFAKLAKQNSGDRGSAAQGGELTGWLERGKLVPPFERAAFDLKPGEISGLVRTRFGFHIIKKLDQRKAEQIPFKEVEAQLVARVRAEYMADNRGEFLKPFAATKAVDVDDAFFEAVKRD